MKHTLHTTQAFYILTDFLVILFAICCSVDILLFVYANISYCSYGWYLSVADADAAEDDAMVAVEMSMVEASFEWAIQL